MNIVAQESNPLRFDRVLCFAVFPYLSDANSQQLLACLNQRFANVCSVFVGNIPDPECAAEFFQGLRSSSSVELDNPESQIGVWRTRGQMTVMAEQAGWRVHFRRMPRAFYQAHYRYNAIFERATEQEAVTAWT